MNEDDLSPLPTKGVTFKDFNTHLPDIKEATLEGSQFEAPVYTGTLSPSRSATPIKLKSPLERLPLPDASGSAIPRPKTSVPRRTASEKSLKEDELPKSTNISRNPSQNSLQPGAMDLHDGHLSERSVYSNSQLSIRRTPHLETSDLRSNSHLSAKGSNGDSRSHSQISRKLTNGDVTPHGKKETPSRQSSLKPRNAEGGYVTPESREIVRRKGKVVENSW